MHVGARYAGSFRLGRVSVAATVLGLLMAGVGLCDGDFAPPDPPFWPVALYAPPKDRKPVAEPAATNKPPPSGDILVWTPPEAKKIRAFLMIVNNAQSKHFGEFPRVREAAVKHGMGIVYFRSLGVENDMDNFPALMNYIAEKSGVVEFRHAPFIAYGQSSRGQFPFRMAWKFPKRTIATIDHHAETPTWPPAEWATFEDESILHVNLNGELEWGATFAVHVRPSLLNYRARTPWLPHQAVAQGIDHTNYGKNEPPLGQNRTGKATQIEVWNYLGLFVDKALALRLPEGFPTEQPIPLRKVDPSKGYLIERFAVEDSLGIPRLQLEEGTNGLYVVKPEAPAFNGYAAIPPATGYTPPEGVPVVQAEIGMSPTNWLVTDGLGIVMKADPMQDVAAFTALRPKPGDEVEIDGTKTAFHPITDREIGHREAKARGITTTALKGYPGKRKLSFVAYTVLEVAAPRAYKISCGHSMAVRSRLILNGVPVDNGQVVQLEKGLYPLVLAVRMDWMIWGHFEPELLAVSDEDVVQAKATDGAKQKALAEFRERQKNPREPMSYIHKYNDVPEAERSRMFWIADEEQARAWAEFHDPRKRQPK